MTQEQKEKLEQAAKDYIKPFAHQLHLGADEGLIMDLVGFAQTILDNPGEWGLIYPHSQKLAEEVLSMQSQLAKYKKALEKITQVSGNPISSGIAKEALKQQEQ